MSTKPLHVGKLTQILSKRKDYNQYITISEILNKRGSDYASLHNKEDFFTSHSYTHLMHVEEYIYRMLGDKASKLKSEELYLLICAIYLHDHSMAITGKRECHHIESEKYVLDNKELFIDENCPILIGKIIRSHGEDDLDALVNKTEKMLVKMPHWENIRIGLLMALLRMGDLLDICEDRAPVEIAKERDIYGQSILHWAAHSWIKNVEFIKDTIFIVAKPTGPFSARILQEKLYYIKNQLETNRKYLNSINIDYKSVEWDKSTLDKMVVYTEKEHSKNYLTPFVDFDEEAYLYLHGRDSDEDRLIRAILHARTVNKITVLVGPSRIGKTSLIRGRIEPAFNELGFDHVYFSGNMPTIEQYSKVESAHSKIVIIDQAERLFGHDDTTNENNHLALLRDLMKTEKRLYVLFVVRKDCFSKLNDSLVKAGIESTLYLMNHKLGIDVVKRLLVDSNIDFSDDLLCEIDNSLSLMEQDDLTSLQIIVSSILNDDSAFLIDENRIVEKYGSISNMVSTLRRNFFISLFSSLETEQKELLIAACNTRKNGTIRVKIEGHSEMLKALSNKRIINLFPDGSYEFIHDSLAEFFCDEILSDKDIELLDLRIAINEKKTTPDILFKIQQYRDKLVELNQFSEKAIGKLIYFYARENNDEQMEYWIKRYKTIGTLLAVIDCFVEGLYNLLQQINPSLSGYRKIYNDCISTFISILGISKNSICTYIENHRNIYNQYLYFCVLDDLKLIDQGKLDAMIAVNGYKETQNALLIEPSYKPVFLEIYYMLQTHNMLDQVVQNGYLARFWLERIGCIIQSGIGQGFYRRINNPDSFVESKYCRMISIILNLLSLYDRDGNFKIVSGLIQFHSDSFIIKDDNGNSHPIESSNDKEKILKFVFNEELYVASLYRNDNMETIALMKYFSDDSFALFRRKDVENAIRKFKIFFNKKHEMENFCKRIIAFLGDRSIGWDSLKLSIEDNWRNILTIMEKDTDLQPWFIPNTTPLHKLIAALCCITYRNLREKNQYDHVQIFLKKQYVNEGSLDLYDSFYIKLYNSEKGSDLHPITIDPYGLRGSRIGSINPIEFILPTNCKECFVNSWTIEHEVQHQQNAENAIAVVIGNRHDQIWIQYRNAFSYILFWDDWSNQVLKTVDEWEYELNKLLKVLQTNDYITDIFIIGNIEDCIRGVSYLYHYCKPDDNADIQKSFACIDVDELSSSSLFLFDDASKILGNRYVHIIPFIKGELYDKKDALNKAINEYYFKQGYVVNYRKKSSNSDIDDNDDLAITEYLKDRIKTCEDTIIGKDLDDAYRQTIAMLTVYGEHQLDSNKKRMRELKGIMLVIPNIDKNHYFMSYRRKEIDNYYQSQWLDEEGEIYKSIHAHQELKINQLDTIIRGIVETIHNEKGNRRLMFSFYNPTASSVSNFKIPSLLQCNIFIRYEGNNVYLDSLFSWRTNECVLGLPMSLESSIRWLDEVIVSEVNKRLEKKKVKLGRYKYFGINLHCFDNDITKKMIARIIEKGN